MKRFTLVTLLLIIAMVMVACGGTANTTNNAAAPADTANSNNSGNNAMTEEEPMEEEMVEEAGNTIVDVAVADGRFETLVTAVTAAGLAETLASEGEFTVFAPTDDAFAALPEGTLDALLADAEGALTDVLLYHVVEGAVMAETVVTLESAATLQGEEVSIAVTDGNVFLNDDVQVVITDIEASNGVIHVVDAVLLPPSMAAAEAPSIAEIAAADENFSTLVTALDAAGLVETLAGEGEFTVFAPTNDAFAALPEGTVEALLADAEGALTDVLLYHVVAGAVMAETVVTLESAATLQGEEVSIAVTDGNVFLNDDVQVVITDIEASNGVIHVVDAVLLPPSMAAAEAPSIAEIAAADENFSTLVTALDAAGLVETLAGEGEFTVFAPTNDAFLALPDGTLDTLLADPSGALTNVLLYHVVAGAVNAETVVTLESAATLQGEEVSIAVNEGNVFLNENVQVVITDIEASNGIVHVIDAVLLPPSMAAAEMPSIAEIAAADENFSTLVTALDAAGLVETLAGEGEFTVFAPTNDAFLALPDGTLDTLLADPSGALTNVLLYHVVEGAVPAEVVVTLDSAMTLNGEEVSITVTDGSVFLNDTVQVVVTDIQASNGIIHVIDTVLVPAS